MEYGMEEEENAVLGDKDMAWGDQEVLLGDIENGDVDVVRVGVCKSVDFSKIYHEDYCDGRMSLALMVAMLVLGFVTIFVNLGVIIRTVKILRQGHDKPAFYFIGNLALSDFAVGMFVVIAFLLHITNKSDLWRQSTCMLQIGVAVTACQETIFTIVLISVDKYLYICHGLHYSTIMTRKRVYSALIVSWCLALLVGSLPAMGLHVTWEEACNRCVFAQVISTPFAIIFFVTSVAVPLAVVVALYSVLLALALRMQKARYGGSYTGNESARSSNFRLSFMSTKSKSSTRTSKASLSNATSTDSSSSKASRRRIRRKEMEEYKAELARRDAADGGTGGGRVTGPTKPPEGVKLIQETDGGVSKGAASPTAVPEGVGDVRHVPEGATEVKGVDEDASSLQDTPLPAEGDAEGDKETETQRDTTTTNGLREGPNRDEKTEEDPGPLEEPPPLTSDDEAATEDETEERRGWRAMFPSKYMNKVMTETRDKVLFLKKCRAMKTVLLILFSFTATYVPFVVGSLVYSADQQKRPCLLHLLNTLLYCAVVANSLANPLIYAYGYREFRLRSEKFKGIFAREKPRPYT